MRQKGDVLDLLWARICSFWLVTRTVQYLRRSVSLFRFWASDQLQIFSECFCFPAISGQRKHARRRVNRDFGYKKKEKLTRGSLNGFRNIRRRENDDRKEFLSRKNQFRNHEISYKNGKSWNFHKNYSIIHVKNFAISLFFWMNKFKLIKNHGILWKTNKRSKPNQISRCFLTSLRGKKNSSKHLLSFRGN